MSDGLVTEAVGEEERPCRDMECGGIAEPEVDGSHRYWECGECGFCFGYEQIEGTKVSVGDSCAIGVPEPVRRAYEERHVDASRETVAKNARSLPIFGGN